MDGNDSTRSDNAGRPQISAAFRNTSFDRSFNCLKGVKKAFFRIVNKIVPKLILNMLLPVDTERIRKGLRDRGIRVNDKQQIRQIADIMQSRVCIGMEDVLGVIGTGYTLVPTTCSCQIAGIACDYQLPQRGRFTPVFYDQDTTNQPPAAIVNAGSLDGHIGGGGLNKLFASVAPFAGAPHRKRLFKRSLNERLHDQAAGEGHITTYDLSTRDSGMKSVTLYKTESNHAGSVAVYEYSEHPHGNTANQAMVYVIPPRRLDYTTDKAFLTAVEQTATNMITVYNQYASQKQNNHEAVPELHIHAFSAGSYAGPVSPAVITKAILKGVHDKCQALAKSGTLHIPKMRFSAPFDHTLSHFSTDPHYLDSTIPIAIDPSLPVDDKAFLAFLNGDGQINGHTRQVVSHYAFSRLETAHNYIQAVFPNKIQGLAEAPLLSPTLLNVLNAAENEGALRKYIEDMLVHTLLPFWGIRHESTLANTAELDFSQGQFSIDNIQQSTVWRTKNTDHNHRRITRVIHFLMEVGYQDYAQKLCQFMQEKRSEMRLPPIMHWNIAAKLPPHTGTSLF
ncbi:hypothetical protein GCM10023116_24720 [Kistimonas scapharcae]|uniref:Opioid growth factor receptor (OGFr) conserved domain-containing protein n=1 Tax=Kistimonas scapharcae TaxID=1036133 RepID=A0ABP8V464_9GAMM